MFKNNSFTVIFILLSLMFFKTIISKPNESSENSIRPNKVLDTEAWIDCNNLLMLVSNNGAFAYDLDAILGKTDGLYFPFTSIADIQSGDMNKSVLYASGLWIGGLVNSELRVSVAEFTQEYVPGPMIGGTFDPDAFTNPDYKVYKLYKDSLEGNPNNDYLNWPVGQGAPTDSENKPIMKGDQMLWTVFNDADPSVHTNRCGGTSPLNIEVQQTVWGIDEIGTIPIQQASDINVTRTGDNPVTLDLVILDNNALINANYQVIVEVDLALGPVWHLYNLSDNLTLAFDQTNFSGDENYPIFDGIMFKVIQINGLKSFEVISNADGPLDPIEAGAFFWAEFPVPTDADADGMITDNQQTNGTKWGIHTGNIDSYYYYYSDFIYRTFRDDPERFNNLGFHDWEIRFTGSNNNPGVGGCYAWRAFREGDAMWVPFELWRVGNSDLNDPSDDLKLNPWIYDDGNGVFDLSSYGSEIEETCNPSMGCDHTVSGNDDDPYTDWIYWKIPANETPGTGGYDQFEAVMLTDPYSWMANESDVMDRMVLVNLNSTITQPPFPYSHPEQGTTFRLKTYKVISGTSEFAISVNRPETIATTGPEGLSVYLEYKLYNKGYNTINDCYISLWFDSDLGGYNDDFVACDTLNNSFYSYNATNNDMIYSNVPPVVGGKIIYGPLIDSAGEYAFFDGKILFDHLNLGMTSFQHYINGTDPDNQYESYNCMRGFKRDGFPLDNGTKFSVPGDPVTGTGDLDNNTGDRRMMANMGPFTFNPGDSQYVMVKLAVGQGFDRLNSITVFKDIMSNPFSVDCCQTPGDANHNGVANIADLTYFIDYMFHGSPPPICYEEFDNNGNCEDGISNLTYFVDWMFQDGPGPVDCHICDK